MTTKTTTALGALAGPCASDDLIEHIAQAVLDRAAHDHPEPGQGEDFHCMNLAAYMGERMRSVLIRLRETDARRKQVSEQRAALVMLHEYDELIFGGYICTHCTPDDCDDPGDNVAWPCPSLRAIGVTDEEATALILARRVEIEAKARREAEEAAR